MEYMAGYAMAKGPYSSYEVEPPPPRPNRANSTSVKPKKRSRIHGHARTNSASTSSSGGRAESLAQIPSHNGGWSQHPPGGADTSAPGEDGAPATRTSSQQHHVLRRESTRERDRTTSPNYYQDKQLPATPRLSTQDKFLGASCTSEPSSARTPASATATTFPDRRMPQHAAMHPDTVFAMRAVGSGGLPLGSSGPPRAESISSASGATTTSNRTMFSSEQASSSAESSEYQSRPFVTRNGRTYISDPTLPYPLPVDLEETHHQSLKTMLLMQLYGRPICSPTFADKPPRRILEVGCGTGFWSMMCYKHYEALGQHKDISFTGIDIVPLAPTAGPGIGEKQRSGETSEPDSRPDAGMNWRFVQHDLRRLPLPFPDANFDLVMVKDMGLATPMTMQQGVVEEYIRVLAPGGTLEIWETDHVLRMLRPHVPDQQAVVTTSSAPTTPSAENDATTTPTITTPSTDHDGPASSSSDQPPHHPHEISDLGAYVLTGNTPLSTPLNNFLVEYNTWIARALEARALAAVPCTLVAPLLMQEAEVLTNLGSRRLAVPLSEIRWEREGVGGVVTKDGKSYIETGKLGRKGKEGTGAGAGSSSSAGGASGSATGGGKGGLEPGAAALRRTALMTVVRQIQSLEPILREVSGKSMDEWDTWMGKMMNDLVRENGTSWGECLEVGAWWARKR